MHSYGCQPRRGSQDFAISPCHYYTHSFRFVIQHRKLRIKGLDKACFTRAAHVSRLQSNDARVVSKYRLATVAVTAYSEVKKTIELCLNEALICVEYIS